MNEHQAGFTLIEVLAALLAGTLLLLSLTAMLSSLGGELRQPKHAPDMAAVGAVAPILTSMLESALPASEGQDEFEAAADHLVARIPPPLALGPIGPMKFTLEAAPSSNGVGLFTSITAADPAIALPLGISERRLIADGFRDIEFSYEEHTDAAVDLPRLIRIRLTTDDGKIYPLAIEPRITSAGACRFDPISMTCRA
jgi:prepilin-type N-terminal cleavage/methylation domain-containing protein